MTNSLTTIGETKIGSRYQAVIPLPVRRIASEVKPGNKAMVIPVDRYSVIISVRPQSWTEATLGSAKGVWTGVDVDQYLENLRKEDQSRVSKWMEKNSDV